MATAQPETTPLTPIAVGVTHHRAPLEIREQLAKTQPRSQASPHPGVLLDTCNRVELYDLASDQQYGLERIRSYFSARWGGAQGALDSYLETYTGEEAVRHLFRVASGLDSLVVGETEILGQVGAALHSASQAGPVGRPLVHLFHDAVRTGRRVRVETGISRQAGSISTVAVNLAQQILGSLSGCRVLVVGAGEAGRLSARALAAAGASELLVTNRTEERAAELAEELGGTVVPWPKLHDSLARVDVLITATGAPGYLVTAEDLRTALAARSERPLRGRSSAQIVILDIAVPRDVDPKAAGVAGVTLHNVDTLQAAVDAGLNLRRGEIQKVEAIIEEETARFRAWLRASDAVPTIRDLFQSAEDLRRQELEKAFRLLPTLSSEDREVIEALSRSLIQKLLHKPVSSLRDGAGDEAHIAATRRLFHLDTEGTYERQ